MIEINPVETTRFSVIWLHGLGADGNDFVPVVEAMNLPDNAGIRFVFPHAPVQPVTINGGMEMRSWYDIKVPNLAAEPDYEGIQASVDSVNNIIDAEIKRGTAEDHIIIAGFSQGGLVALATGLHRKLRGIIALSCYLPKTLYPAKVSMPVFIGHGSFDDVVPVAQGELLETILKDIGSTVTANYYPMAHSVSAEEILDIKEWLMALIGME